MNFDAIMKELKKVVYGKDDVLEKILLCLLAKGHVLLEDVPGVGKTTMAMAFSKVFELNENRMQFTSDVMPSDVIGFNMYDRATNSMKFHKGPVHCNMFLADEINRTSSKTQSALLEVMEEGNVTIDAKTYEMDKPFFVLATQNPYGSAGTNMLPQSQMDRFMIAISVGYPSPEAEIDILQSRNKVNPLNSVVSVCSKAELLKLQEQVENVYVDKSIYEYAVALSNKTRNNANISIGCSPRGTLAIMRLAKAKAFISNRNYVIPTDISSIFVDACSHRIIPKSHDKSCISKERRNILLDILNSTPQPSIKKREV